MPESNSFSVMSVLPLRTVLPSGEKAQARTQSECPLSVHFSLPAKTSTIQPRRFRRDMVSDDLKTSRKQFLRLYIEHSIRDLVWEGPKTSKKKSANFILSTLSFSRGRGGGAPTIRTVSTFLCKALSRRFRRDLVYIEHSILC